MYLDLVKSSFWAAWAARKYIDFLCGNHFLMWSGHFEVPNQQIQQRKPGQKAWKGAVVAIQALAAYQWLWFKSFRLPILCVNKMKKILWGKL